MSNDNDNDHSDFWLAVWIVIIGILALGGGGAAYSQRDDRPADPTGICNRPTSQLNC